MFTLSPKPIQIEHYREGLIASSAGAFNTFEGWVRDHNEGKKVEALEYEAYDALCVSEAQKILKEVSAKFDIITVQCVHRIGKLKIGDLAVWVGVSAVHRDDSFKACRYVIDEIKSRLPIWKKEYYANGDSGWVVCETCQSHGSVI